jgi:hypothetical protein
MHGAIYQFLAEDHERLDDLLQHATMNPEKIDQTPYVNFRAGLLKHIGMEEKILLPAITRQRGGIPLPIANRLRLDHGALTALLVPPPSPAIIATLREILDAHNTLEEEEGGLYEFCEQMTRDEAESLLSQLRSAPDVPVLPFNDKPEVLDVTRRALARAGYTLRE